MEGSFGVLILCIGFSMGLGAGIVVGDGACQLEPYNSCVEKAAESADLDMLARCEAFK